MMEYNIVKAINNSVNNEFLGQERYYVCYAGGKFNGLRENIVGYDTEAKAKRRIRDLKRKELEVGVHNHLVVPNSEADDVAWLNNFDAPQPFAGNGGGLSQPIPYRPVGVYPAISKHQHQRRAYGKGV